MVTDHSLRSCFPATINATDNSERLPQSCFEDLFQETAAPSTSHQLISLSNKLSQNQLQAERGLVFYDVNLEHKAWPSPQKDSFLATTLYLCQR
ncbi:hypothetical protein NC652_010956 [Populus alba x Populus x berolinensis]|nr:hypothetical protein NC652_010956 [Populus alba x Populus x berolinensis]